MDALTKPQEGWRFEHNDSLSMIGHRQLRVHLPNGYMVSVIHGPYAHGGPEGLFEVAILNPDGSFLVSELTNDDQVLGHLTEKEVLEFCHKVAALPAAADDEVVG